MFLHDNHRRRHDRTETHAERERVLALMHTRLLSVMMVSHRTWKAIQQQWCVPSTIGAVYRYATCCKSYVVSVLPWSKVPANDSFHIFVEPLSVCDQGQQHEIGWKRPTAILHVMWGFETTWNVNQIIAAVLKNEPSGRRLRMAYITSMETLTAIAMSSGILAKFIVPAKPIAFSCLHGFFLFSIKTFGARTKLAVLLFSLPFSNGG